MADGTTSGAATAYTLAAKYKSPRYQTLEWLESYVEGSQYDGREPFLSTEEGAPPLMERAPCIVDGIAKTAIGDLVDFMMGEDRFPFVSGGSSEDDEELDDDWGLDEDKSALLERWINGPLAKSARLRAMFPDALAMAMRARSVALVVQMKRGYPALECMPAKWCTPTFDMRTGEVSRLVIQYPYIIDFQTLTGAWEKKCLIYRRVIDDKTDTVYLPGEAKDSGKEPDWFVDTEQSVVHDLGFCPVRWYAHDRSEPTAASFDGRAIHETLDDEIDALNFGKSMRHRAGLYSGDPQLWEAGTQNTLNVAPMGRHAALSNTSAGADGKVNGVYQGAGGIARGRGGQQGRKKGAGAVWSYDEPTAKVGILTLPPGSLDPIAESNADIRKVLSEAMGVVLMDPSDVKAFGAMSGKALAFMFARQIARADRIRMDAGDKMMLAVIDMLLRLCVVVGRMSPGGIRIPGIKKILPILAMFEREVVTTVPIAGPGAQPATPEPGSSKAWFGPRLELEWGPYFTPSAEEQNFLVTMCVQAYEGGLVPLEIILEKLRAIFSFGSTEELMKKLEEEKAKKQADAMKNAADMASIAGPPKPGAPGTPPGKGAPPPAKAGSASGAKGDAKA